MHMFGAVPAAENTAALCELRGSGLLQKNGRGHGDTLAFPDIA